MSNPAKLVVGIPVYENENLDDEDYPYKFELNNSIEWKEADKLKSENRVEIKYQNYSSKRDFKIHTAGYEEHEEGPGAILGICIFETWMDAIELTPKIIAFIEQAKLFVKEQTNKEPKIFFIGQQT